MPCFWYYDHQSKQPEKAVKIQAWWRRMLEVRVEKKPLKQIFEGDVTGLTGLRCLVLIGVHDDVLGTWARAMIELGPEEILAQTLREHTTSWLVLMRKAAFLLLLSLSHVPESPNASSYLNILMVLLSNERAVATSGAQGSAFCKAITAYLMDKNLYVLLRRSILKLPIKNSTSLPAFLDLCMLPLSTYPKNSAQFTEISVNIFISILSVSFLPNRLPLSIPSPIVSHLLTSLDDLTPKVIGFIGGSIGASSSPDLAANVFMFVSPHYERLSTAAFASYLQLLTKLINNFKTYSWFSARPSESRILREPEPQTNPVDHGSDFSDGVTEYEDSYLDEEDDEEEKYPFGLIVTHQAIKWLENATTSQHITDLLNATKSQTSLLPHLVEYLSTIEVTWPSSQEEIRNTIIANSNGQVIRYLYQEIVRQSPLGQEEDSMNIYEPTIAKHWRPIIFLADLYCQALKTMDDQEFLGNVPGSPGCNPLTLEEVASFSAQLLNIVFTLYWRSLDYWSDDWDEPWDIPRVYVYSETALREKLLWCLLRIHTRDSRLRFLPLGHWLLRSQLDTNSFIDAVVILKQDDFWRSAQMQGDIPLNHRKSMPPRVAILQKIPFAIPFEARVSMFQHLIANDRVFHGSTDRLNALGHSQRLRVKIRRSFAAQDGFYRLAEVNLKGPLEIIMTDEFGQEEEAIDEGGNFKEFFTVFFQQVLQAHFGLWSQNESGDFYPTTQAHGIEALTLDWYWFIGRMVGKAIYEGIMVEARFAYFFLSKWLGRRCYFDDLFSLDPDLYRRLLTLKHSTENIENLSLYFTISTEEFGVTKWVELIPNGREIAVTRENRLRYIDLSSRYRMNAQVKPQSKAFLQGLSQFLQPNWLKIFNQRELQMLIGGSFSPIDVDDLRRHTTYDGVYHNGHETIISFWRVVNSFHSWQKHNLLHFVTNCSFSHVLGFKELVPNFSILDDGSDENRLPTANTCINRLKLPSYKSERQLREMLLEAMTARAGFDSS